MIDSGCDGKIVNPSGIVYEKIHFIAMEYIQGTSLFDFLEILNDG